jgi:hypothetical protein
MDFHYGHDGKKFFREEGMTSNFEEDEKTRRSSERRR